MSNKWRDGPVTYPDGDGCYAASGRQGLRICAIWSERYAQLGRICQTDDRRLLSFFCRISGIEYSMSGRRTGVARFGCFDRSHGISDQFAIRNHSCFAHRSISTSCRLARAGKSINLSFPTSEAFGICRRSIRGSVESQLHVLCRAHAFMRARR